MSIRTIKDPTYNIYASGGNVENRKNTPKRDDLIKLAKDIKDIEFDVEGEVIDIITEDYRKEKKPGQSFLDWLDTKPREYFLNIRPMLAYSVSNEDGQLLEEVIVAGYPLGKKISAAIKALVVQ